MHLWGSGKPFRPVRSVNTGTEHDDPIRPSWGCTFQASTHRQAHAYKTGSELGRTGHDLLTLRADCHFSTSDTSYRQAQIYQNQELEMFLKTDTLLAFESVPAPQVYLQGLAGNNHEPLLSGSL